MTHLLLNGQFSYVNNRIFKTLVAYKRPISQWNYLLYKWFATRRFLESHPEWFGEPFYTEPNQRPTFTHNVTQSLRSQPKIPTPPPTLDAESPAPLPIDEPTVGADDAKSSTASLAKLQLSPGGGDPATPDKDKVTVDA